LKFAKSILMGTGAVVLAGLILALLAPRAAHAIVATAVQVENTRSTPVPNQDVDIAARHPYTANCSVGIPTQVIDTSTANLTCQPMPPPPTAGFETVIQSVNMYLFPTSTTPQQMFLSYFTANRQFGMFIPFIQQTPSTDSNGSFVGSQLTAIYLDNSSTVPLTCQTVIPANTFNNSLQCTVTGYTVALP
jgi:hypothetical protein